MGGSEIPGAGPSAGGDSQSHGSLMEHNHAMPVTLHNSRIMVGVYMTLGIAAAFIAVCMLLMVFSIFSTNGGFSLGNLMNAFWWAFGALAFGAMCPWLWKMGRAMLGYHVVYDSRGVTFYLGTKKKPSNLFLAWDQVAAIKHKRVGNAQQYTVQGKDGSTAVFTSYAFFRPRKVARMVADRTGLAITEG
jgi:hypothetical protein